MKRRPFLSLPYRTSPLECIEWPSQDSKGFVVHDVGAAVSLPTCLVVSRMDDAIYWTKCYLLNNSIDFSGVHPLDRGLSGG